MVQYLISVGVVILCTAISLPLRSRLNVTAFAMLYLLGVIGVSMHCSRRAAVLNAVLSVTAFYYFCIPVHNSWALEDSDYIVTLVVMLITALVVSTLTFRVRAEAGKVIAAEIAVQTERTRNAFLSAVSHDIKTPLSSIYGAATSLLEQAERLNQTERRELIESIANDSERLNRVVNNVLDMTRVESGVELRRDWYPLEEIVGTALTRVESVLGSRTVTTSIAQDLPFVCVDQELMAEVFANILENAGKYSDPDAPIEITAVRDVACIVIFVRDAGPGFAAGEVERVFEKFFRGKTAGARGVGLGLTICRAIVERHGGTIEASNSSRGGAVITIRLPVGGVPPALPGLRESSLT